MCADAFDAWLSLFNDNAANAWAVERKELRNAAMLLNVLDLEFRGIQKAVSDEFSMWQERLNSKRHSQVSPQSKESLHMQKENRAPEHNEIVPLHDVSNQTLLNSDVFLTQPSPEENGIELEKRADISPERDQIIIKATCVSPKINKSWKYSRLKRSRDFSCSLLDITKTPKRISEVVVEDSFIVTPDRSCNNDMEETTIIDVTPEPPQETKKIKHSRLGNLSKQKKKVKGQRKNSTLTQMFSNVANIKNEESIKKDDNDSTYCPIIKIDSHDEYGEPKPASNIHYSPKKDVDDIDITYCPSAEKEHPSKFQDEENLDSTKKQGSKTPCKSISPFKFKAKPVRGKERLKLEGWDCDECKRFYEGMGKNYAEVKDLMNKCSRHRNKFKPDDYTIPGFWDLNFTPTQHTEADQSTIFNF